jgi:hypothetical protein
VGIDTRLYKRGKGIPGIYRFKIFIIQNKTVIVPLTQSAEGGITHIGLALPKGIVKIPGNNIAPSSRIKSGTCSRINGIVECIQLVKKVRGSRRNPYL